MEHQPDTITITLTKQIGIYKYEVSETYDYAIIGTLLRLSPKHRMTEGIIFAFCASEIMKCLQKYIKSNPQISGVELSEQPVNPKN